MSVSLMGVAPQKTYSIYIWRTGWDPDVAGCDNNKFLDWSDSDCFTHSWDTEAKKEWLWKTISRPEREIQTLFLYDTHSAINSGDCNSQEVSYLRQFLREGRQINSDLEVYALFSDGGATVPESRRVPGVVWYNQNCAQTEAEKLTGVAVNNEDYDKNWNEERMIQFLDDLYKVKEEADKQSPAGSLKTHFSVGWHWGINEGNSIDVTWKNKRQSIQRHFIDIFDSLDVQAAFVTAETQAQRLQQADFDYAQENGKLIHCTYYLNRALPCQVTYFPFRTTDSSCVSWSQPYKTEAAMFSEADKLETLLPGVRICLHYFRGAYSSGGNDDWPSYR